MKIKEAAKEIDEMYKRMENLKKNNNDEFCKKIAKELDCVYGKLKDRKKLQILSAGTNIQEVMEHHLKHNDYCVFIMMNSQSLWESFVNDIVLLIRLDDNNVLKVGRGQRFMSLDIYRKKNINGNTEKESQHITYLIYSKDESFYNLVKNNSLCQYLYEKLKNGKWEGDIRVDYKLISELLDMFEI